MDRITWDEYFMTVAYITAQRSPDKHTKLGCVIASPDNNLIAVGYNGIPRGMNHPLDDSPMWERPLKYSIMAHAEENAIINSGRNGSNIVGAKLYVPWLPCNTCARLIISSGIKTVIVHGPGQDAYEQVNGGKHTYTEQHKITMDMFESASVQVIVLETQLNIDAYYNGVSIKV